MVGITKDHTLGVVVPEELRLDGVKAISFIDFEFILRDPPKMLIQKLKLHGYIQIYHFIIMLLKKIIYSLRRPIVTAVVATFWILSAA